MKPILHEKVLESDNDGVILAITNGTDLNELDNLGNSALHWAVMRGDIEIVKILLEAGADPNVISSDGYTPKWSAVDFDLIEIADVLNEYGGKVITNNNFDRKSWSVIKGFLGESMPEDEN